MYAHLGSSLFSFHILKAYGKSIQTFKKYSEPYIWNKVDNLITGEENRNMEDSMRFRRVMFGLIPPKYDDSCSEDDYVAKFKRLVEYLGRLRDKTETETPLNVELRLSLESGSASDRQSDVLKVRRSTADSMLSFFVQLKKGKRDPFEWMEIRMDSIFDTTRSYRIMFNWLVASSTSMD